jgi:hypothetical protein
MKRGREGFRDERPFRPYSWRTQSRRFKSSRPDPSSRRPFRRERQRASLHASQRGCPVCSGMPQTDPILSFPPRLCRGSMRLRLPFPSSWGIVQAMGRACGSLSGSHPSACSAPRSREADAVGMTP